MISAFGETGVPFPRAIGIPFVQYKVPMHSNSGPTTQSERVKVLQLQMQVKLTFSLAKYVPQPYII